MNDPRALVESTRIGEGARFGPFCHVHADAQVGARCFVGAHAVVDAGAVLHEDVVVEAGARVGRVVLERGAIVGPNAVLLDDRRATDAPKGVTRVGAGATVGASSSVLPGLTIGRGATVGAGAVVTRSVPDFAIVGGSPARIIGYQAAGAASSAAAPRDGRAPRLVEVRGAALIELPRFADLRGAIAVGELGKGLPFPPRRFFTVFDVPGEHVRGEHAHRECHQLLVCVHGRIAVVLDDGRAREQVVLDRPTLALHIPPLVWAVQYGHTSSAVLLVLASHEYDAADYIRDYGEFLAVRRGSGA